MAEKTKKFSTKFKILVSLCIVGIMILSFFGGFFTYRLILGKKANSVAWVVNTIEDTYYYDEGYGVIKSFTADDYANAIVNGLLDRYSSFYSKDEYADVVETNKGNNYGSGITLILGGDANDRPATIFAVVGNSPAYHAGLIDGDNVVAYKVNGERKTLKNVKELSDFLVSVSGEFTLIVDRSGVEKEFTLKKRVFVRSFVSYYDAEKSLTFENEGEGELKPIKRDVATALDGKTAFITLTNFNGGASGQFASAMEYMKERGKTKLILDLRKNGGGFMDVLSDISSHLIYTDKKPLIALVKDKKGNEEKFYATEDNFNRSIEKIVAIADDNSASATECLLGAMLYYKRAFSIDNLVVEGDKSPATTYGKGIMQTTYKNFLSGEALKLTTALVYQPDGKTCIHGKGITATAQNSVARGQGLARALQIIAD